METFEQVKTFARNFKDGVLHPFSPSEGKTSNDHHGNDLVAQAGHLAGQFTDAAVASLIAHKLPFLKDAKSILPELEIHKPKLSGESFLHAPATLTPRQTLSARPFSAHSLRADIHITPENYSLMADASHQIESTHVENTTYKLTKPGRPDEYIEKTMPFKFYKLKGLETRVGMPLEFADSLETIRSARLQSSQLSGFKRDRFDDVRAATLRGYDSMILPEQTSLFLRELPNPSLAKELLLLPEADAKAGAAVDRDVPGRVQMFDFKKYLDPYIDTSEAPFYMRHEWAHLAEEENPSLKLAFNLGRYFERKGYFAHETARDSAPEDWAVHLGENIMAPGAKKYYETLKEAPLRSLVLLQSLKQQLAKGEEIMKAGAGVDGSQVAFASPIYNPYRTQLRARVELGEQLLLPEVRSFLEKQLSGTVSGRGVNAHRYAALLKQNGIDLLSSK